MQIRAGYELIYQFPKPTPMILMLNIHHSRASDLLQPDHLMTDPAVPVTAYRDKFANWCSRLIAPPGRMRLSADAVVRDSGVPEPTVPGAWQHDVQDLPEETLLFLLGSRYCRHAARLAARTGDLRFRSQPSRIRLPVREPDQVGIAGVQRAQRGVS